MMTSVCLAILTVGAMLLFDAVTLLADCLARRDDLNTTVSPLVSQVPSGGSAGGPLSPASLDLE